MEQNQAAYRKNIHLKEETTFRKNSLPKYFSNLSQAKEREVTSNSQLSDYQKGIVCKSQRWITNNTKSDKNTSFTTARHVTPIPDMKTFSEYMTARRDTDEQDNLVIQLQKQVENLKITMKNEIEELKKRLVICEETNQQLLTTIKSQINQPPQQTVSNTAKAEFDAIAEEYKSKKREIQEFTYKADAVPTIGFNIKELQRITAQKSKQFGVKKRESVQVRINFIINQGQIVKQYGKLNEQKFKQHQSFLMKTPDSMKKHDQKTLSSIYRQFDDEVGNDNTIPLQMNTHPQESPYRGFQNKRTTIQEALQQNIDKTTIDSNLCKETFGEPSYRNKKDEFKQDSYQSSLPQSPIISNRDRIFQGQCMLKKSQNHTKGINNNNGGGGDSSNRGLSKSQLGIATVVENPKFLDFVNANSSRGLSLIQSIFSKKSKDDKESTLINQVRNVNTQKIKEESKKSDMSPSYFYKKWLDITSKERTRESEQSTERAEKPSLRNRHVVDSRNAKMERSTSSMEDDEEEMESDDCDEKRSYTPEPKHMKNLITVPAKSLNHSIIGLKGPISTQNVNSVYTSSKMELSRYISNNKSNLDIKNSYNMMEFGGKQALIDSKGSKCLCKKQQQQQKQIENQSMHEFNFINSMDKRAACGEFCKSLTPVEQKKVILDCLKKELNQANYSQLGKASQKQKKYLIEGKWWRKWCDYVNFDSVNLNASLGTIDNQIQEISQIKRESKAVRAYDSSTLYCKPDRIANEKLLEKQQKGSAQKLRENLVEHFDFESLSPQVWLHLYSWYSADCQIARYLKKDKLNTNSFMLELYPDTAKNLSFLGYNSSESSDGEDSKNDSSGGTPEIKTVIINQNNSMVSFNKQKTSINNKISFFGITIPQRSKISNKSQDFIEMI